MHLTIIKYYFSDNRAVDGSGEPTQSRTHVIT